MSLIAAPVAGALGFCLFDDRGPAAQVANRRVSRNRLPGRGHRCSVTVALRWGLQEEAGEPAALLKPWREIVILSSQINSMIQAFGMYLPSLGTFLLPVWM